MGSHLLDIYPHCHAPGYCKHANISRMRQVELQITVRNRNKGFAALLDGEADPLRGYAQVGAQNLSHGATEYQVAPGLEWCAKALIACQFIRAQPAHRCLLIIGRKQLPQVDFTCVDGGWDNCCLIWHRTG